MVLFCFVLFLVFGGIRSEIEMFVSVLVRFIMEMCLDKTEQVALL